MRSLILALNLFVIIRFSYGKESLDKRVPDTLTLGVFVDCDNKAYHVTCARERIVSMIIKNSQNNPVFFSNEIM